MTKNWDAELYEARHAFVWQLGENVMELLAPKAGERILDLGCGPGQLTKKISQSGAAVIGLDSSPPMIGQARQNYPELQFVLQDAAAMEFENEFDAVFSNAALHWMLDAAAVVQAVARALHKGGRFVLEMGGKGNIQIIEGAIRTVVAAFGNVPASRTYYPSIAEYSTLLEDQGLEVRQAFLFDRPTPLETDDGLANWIKQFKWYYFEELPLTVQQKALAEVVSMLRPKLNDENGWFADYRRLRIEAVK